MVIQAIEGKLIRLRTADVSDAEFTRMIRQDDSNTKYMPKLQVTIEQQANWIVAQEIAEDSVFFVVERESGEKIGTFSLYNIENNTAESGRMIIRGNPIETVETVLLFHDFAFLTMDLQTVYSEIEEDNLPAQGVAKCVGAINYGYLNECDLEHRKLKFIATRLDYEKARVKLQRLVDRFCLR